MRLAKAGRDTRTTFALSRRSVPFMFITRALESRKGERMHSSLRTVSNLLSIFSLCDRAKCWRAKQCKGEAVRCLILYSKFVPREAREFIVDLMVSRELGYSFEEAMRRSRTEAKLFFAWKGQIPRRSAQDESVGST